MPGLHYLPGLLVISCDFMCCLLWTKIAWINPQFQLGDSPGISDHERTDITCHEVYLIGYSNGIHLNILVMNHRESGCESGYSRTIQVGCSGSKCPHEFHYHEASSMESMMLYSLKTHPPEPCPSEPGYLLKRHDPAKAQLCGPSYMETWEGVPIEWWLMMTMLWLLLGDNKQQS